MLKVLVVLTCLVPLWAYGLEYRIVNGTKAEPFSYLASLRLASLGPPGIHYCGGAILNERYILTTATCLFWPPELMAVSVGSNYIVNPTEKLGVASYVLHQDYNETTLEHDIGILELEQPLEFNENVQPLSLPGNHTETLGGTRAEFAGWGSTTWPVEDEPNILQWMESSIVNPKDCAEAIAASPWGEVLSVHPGQICYGGEKQKGLCHGDGGGPLVVDGNSVVGLASWVVPCAAGYPDIFTKVSYYVDWLQTQMDLMDARRSHVTQSPSETQREPRPSRSQQVANAVLAGSPSST